MWHYETDNHRWLLHINRGLGSHCLSQLKLTTKWYLSQLPLSYLLLEPLWPQRVNISCLHENLKTLYFAVDVSPCPEGWTFFFKAKKCYKYFPVIKDFNGARALCQENGGDIAIATELGENNFVSFTFTDQKLWLGGQRIGATKDFQWTYRGEVVSDTTKFIPQQFLPWLPNQPSNSGGDENCVITNWPSDSNRLSEWNDISCSRNDLAQVVCEKPQDIVPSNNNLIGNIATWGKSFRISFDLKFDSWPTATTWSSLLHFTTNPSRDCCSIGQRIPAFYLTTYGGGRRLNVYTQLGSKGNAGLSAVVYWNLGTWYNVEVEQSLEGTKVK